MDTFSRRILLTAMASAALCAALPSGQAFALPAPPPLPPGTPDRRLFTAAEQRFAPYLLLIPPMVTDMTEAGFFAGGWWRTPAADYNARVQEHVYTLAWFATQGRSWNPYLGDATLLAALDAGLGHYLGLQHPDGSWPEYSITEHGLAPTGFGIGYLSKTNALLRKANVLPQRQAQITAALRQAMTWFLDPANGSVWQPKLTFANQVTAGLAGSALALNQDPDPVLRGQLTSAFARLATNGQSPAGFFYEVSGADQNYNFEVMLPEMADAWRQSDDPNLVAMAEKYTAWLGFNLLREPDGSGWFTNVATSSRTSARYYADVRPDPDRTALGSQFVPEVPALGAFFTAAEDLALARSAWAADPAPVAPLVKPDTSPRILTHAWYGERFPRRSARKAAIARLPYLRSQHFAEIRSDQGQDFLFLRRPGFYLGGYFGTRRASSLARTGLTFLWHPVAGTVIQSLNDNNYACWATVFPGQVPDSDGPLAAEFLGGEPYAFRYHTPSGSVVTDVTVGCGRITRSVTANAPATEQIPFVLHPADQVVFTNGTTAPYGGTVTTVADSLTLRRGKALLRVGWGSPLSATLAAATVTYPGARMHVLRVPHGGTIRVTISG